VTVGRVDHTAIVVRDLDEAMERYRALWGVEAADRGVVPGQHVEVAFLRLGDTQIELIRPTSGDSGVARFLERHGEGLHHVAITVPDLKAELARLEQQGVELIDRQPRAGLHGQVAFVHPKSTGGVLVELIEEQP
jgi:methylmalonyl-CoA/ethylmalonyl-CoA epimerase